MPQASHCKKALEGLQAPPPSLHVVSVVGDPVGDRGRSHCFQHMDRCWGLGERSCSASLKSAVAAPSPVWLVITPF